MGRLSAFESITVDGYFTDPKGDIGWAHGGPPDKEFEEYTQGNAKGSATLVFGRVTYEMMVKYWPTPAARKDNPVIAERMNAAHKIVFSKSLKKPDWSNTDVVKGDIVAEMQRLKAENEDLVILGSGTIVAQMARAGLVDAYTFVLVPVVLGAGRTLFDGIKDRQKLRLTNSRSFKSGRLVLSYEPAA